MSSQDGNRDTQSSSTSIDEPVASTSQAPIDASSPMSMANAVSVLQSMCPEPAIHQPVKPLPADEPTLRSALALTGLGNAGNETPRAYDEDSQVLRQRSGSQPAPLDMAALHIATQPHELGSSAPSSLRRDSYSNGMSQSPTTPRWAGATPDRPVPRRQRSRHASRTYENGHGLPSRLSFSSLAAVANGWDEDPMLRKIVMTPTTEEWRNASPGRSGRKTPIHSDDEGSSDELAAEAMRTRSSSRASSIQSTRSDLSGLRLGRPALTPNRSRVKDSARDAEDVSDDEHDMTTPHATVDRQRRASLAAHSVTSVGSSHSIADIVMGQLDSNTLLGLRSRTPIDTTPTKPIDAAPLDVMGPLDPRSYSARTGVRSISTFVVEGEDAGKGAYGSVRRARERGADGNATGRQLVIKYIVKERILADCWKKHKILGPIPVEIHVLDHICRVPHRSFLPLDAGQTTLDLPQTGHPNVCGMLDFFEDQEQCVLDPVDSSDAHSYFLLMPFFGQGQDLFDYVDAAPDGLPAHEVKSFFGQVADALAFLHAMGVVHRDIKDENVILDGRGNVALIDFGSAAYVRSDNRKFDSFSGTLDFAAPEVLRSERYDGKLTDIWALGVLGYVLICGECPFWNSQEAIQGLGAGTRAAEALEAKRASGAVDGQSLELAIDLVSRCLETSELDRPSAEQVCRHQLYAGDRGWSGPQGWLEQRSM